MEMNAIASTPIRPARRSRTIDKSNPVATGTVPMPQIHFAASANPAAQTALPMASAPAATAISARRPARSIFAASTREP